jgi:hypothetical protein
MRCSRCDTTAPRSTRNEYLTRTNGLYNDDDDEVDNIKRKDLETYLVQYGCDKETISILFNYGVHSLHDMTMLRQIKIDTKFKGCTELQKQKIKNIFAKFYADQLEEQDHRPQEIERMVSEALASM